MPDYSPHQKKIIERYYDHRDEIMLGKLQEIVTDLFLAETEKKVDQLWKRAEKAMSALKIKESVAKHLLEQRKVEPLARSVREWLVEAKNGRSR